LTFNNGRKMKEVLKMKKTVTEFFDKVTAFIVIVTAFVLIYNAIARSPEMEDKNLPEIKLTSIVSVLSTADRDEYESEAPEYETDDDWAETVEFFLDENIWNNADYDTRVEYCKKMIKIEKKRLGIKKIIIFKAESGLAAEGMLGYYSDTKSKIAIDRDKIMVYSGDIILNAVCHECRHAWQHRLVEERFLYVISDPEKYETGKRYAEEFDNYVSLTEDYDIYYNQEVEVDARFYAEAEVNHWRVYRYAVKNQTYN